jgi:hypothetical protein
MKLSSASLLTGIGLAISALTAVPAFAVSSTGFSLFHVENTVTGTQNAYLCLTESNGAVVNNCTYDVNLEFNLTINSLGKKSISVQNLWDTTPPSSFTCVAYAYSGVSNSSYAQTDLVYNPTDNAFSGSIDVTESGSSIQVICWGVPEHYGIANINWNPF